MAERDIMYYPVHLTAGYEKAIEMGPIQSEVCVDNNECHK